MHAVWMYEGTIHVNEWKNIDKQKQKEKRKILVTIYIFISNLLEFVVKSNKRILKKRGMKKMWRCIQEFSFPANILFI